MEDVAGRLPFEPARTESLPEVGHVALERVSRGVRWFLAPDLINENVGGDHLVRAHDEVGEYRSLLGAAERDGPPLPGDLERA
jgi:hypothetical protein